MGEVLMVAVALALLTFPVWFSIMMWRSSVYFYNRGSVLGRKYDWLNHYVLWGMNSAVSPVAVLTGIWYFIGDVGFGTFGLLLIFAAMTVAATLPIYIALSFAHGRE